MSTRQCPKCGLEAIEISEHGLFECDKLTDHRCCGHQFYADDESTDQKPAAWMMEAAKTWWDRPGPIDCDPKWLLLAETIAAHAPKPSLSVQQAVADIHLSCVCYYPPRFDTNGAAAIIQQAIDASRQYADGDIRSLKDTLARVRRVHDAAVIENVAEVARLKRALRLSESERKRQWELATDFKDKLAEQENLHHPK